MAHVIHLPNCHARGVTGPCSAKQGRNVTLLCRSHSVENAGTALSIDVLNFATVLASNQRHRMTCNHHMRCHACCSRHQHLNGRHCRSASSSRHDSGVPLTCREALPGVVGGCGGGHEYDEALHTPAQQRHHGQVVDGAAVSKAHHAVLRDLCGAQQHKRCWSFINKAEAAGRGHREDAV